MENNFDNGNNKSKRRHVEELIEIFDDDQKLKIMTIQKSETGLLTVMLSFMTTVKNEEVSIFKTVLLKKVFSSFDFSMLFKGGVLKKFKEYLDNMYDIYYESVPLQVARMEMLVNTYSYVRNYSITNFTRIEDFDLYNLRFYLEDMDESHKKEGVTNNYLVMEYPLIPEILPFYYNDYLHCKEYSKLLIYSIYIDSFVDALRKQNIRLTKEDRMIIDMIHDLSDENNEYLSEFNPAYEQDMMAIIYGASQELYVQPTKYNNIEMFSKELFERYVVLKSRDFFDAISDIYKNYYGKDSKDYKSIVEDIYEFFDRLGLVNEQKCMKNIIEKKGSKYFVNSFYYYLNSFITSKEYISLFEDLDNGNDDIQRGRSK